MGKHAKIEPGQKVASVFVPISRSGLSKQLLAREWRKDLLMSWLFQTSIRLQTSLDRRFLRFGMTVQEAGVLLRCVEARIITPGQLAVGLGRDKGMITRFIDRLEFSRLIIRDINPRDRRFSVIKPTAITDGYHFPTSPRRVLFEFRRRRMPGCELPAMSGLAVCGKNAEPESSGAKARWITRALYRSGKPRAYIPRAETRRVFAWASSGRSERMPSQFFSNWV